MTSKTRGKTDTKKRLSRYITIAAAVCFGISAVVAGVRGH